jgi:hypothetical protein
MTIAIAFDPGVYGTYLEWCLTTLADDRLISLPFTATGNSHKFLGNHLLDINGWNNFLLTHRRDALVRFHPKTQQDHNLSENLDHVCATAEFLVYLYPSRDHVLLAVNNCITKIWDNWWQQRLLKDSLFDKIYQNWPVDKGATANEIPMWIRREFLSFYLMPAWFGQVEWFQPDKWSNPKACIVTTKDLLFNFESTLYRIQKHTNIKFLKPVSDLLPAHEQNLKLQKNLTQDQLCSDIIDSVLSGVDFGWEPLPLGSESWVQWELRNRGFEIQCDGLDIFPTNSIQLRELLYSV